jgi:predicted DNA-binding transcriptional regulator AlpA
MDLIELIKTAVGEEIAEKVPKIIKEELHMQFSIFQENTKIESDIIFVKEVSKITGYEISTLYSKVSRSEIPVLSRKKPLTFSKKEIISWLHKNKPPITEENQKKIHKT